MAVKRKAAELHESYRRRLDQVEVRHERKRSRIMKELSSLKTQVLILTHICIQMLHVICSYPVHIVETLCVHDVVVEH